MTAVDLLLVAWAAAPALLWGVVAERSWHFLRSRHPRSTLFRILPPMAACAALGYGAVTALVVLDEEPGTLRAGVPGLLIALAGATIARLPGD